jgi:NAD(P)-dependent dehydrogenase (short-subunit alcohol dehydrogenase family)
MSDDRLAGKRVAVTGAARGLGRAFVLHLARSGARVLAADVLAEELERTCALAREAGGEAHGLELDVRSPVVLATARDLLGGLDALVNNAAVVEGLARRPFDEIPEDEWDRVLDVNVKGVWLCTRAAVPLLREAGGGSIVNIASEVAYTGSPGLVHYVASKAAVVGLTRVLARELGPFGIRVNALAPGFVPTDAALTLTDAAAYDTTATPLGRIGEPADLLGALSFLLSDESAFVTGQSLLVSGGRTLR